jgi:hypothetical protein
MDGHPVAKHLDWELGLWKGDFDRGVSCYCVTIFEPPQKTSTKIVGIKLRIYFTKII